MTTFDNDLFNSVEDEEPIVPEINDFVSDEQKPIDYDVLTEANERKPSHYRGRHSAARLIEQIAGFVGMGLIQSQRDIPVGRVITFEAPLIGVKFDEVLAGTFLDRLIQPFVRGTESAESIGALVAFPILVGAYERNPALAPVVGPILRNVVESVIVDIAPVLKKQHKDRQKSAKAIADLSEVFADMDLDPNADPIDAIIGSIFDMSGYIPATAEVNDNGNNSD